MAELAQAGILRAVEKYVSWGNLPIVTDFVFCEDLRGRSVIPGKIHPPKSGIQIIIKKLVADFKGSTVVGLLFIGKQ